MTRAEREALLVRQIGDAHEALTAAASILADQTLTPHDARPAAAIKVGQALGVLEFEPRLDQ